MNCYQARQRADGRWEFTCLHEEAVVPVGYCAGWPNFEAMKWSGVLPPAMVLQNQCEAWVHEEWFHRDGHGTREEAETCYRRYLMDLRLDLKAKLPCIQKPCAECGAWTQRVAQIGNLDLVVLCEEHCTREMVEKHWVRTMRWERS